MKLSDKGPCLELACIKDHKVINIRITVIVSITIMMLLSLITYTTS